MATREALAVAEAKGLDLVEVAPQAQPPVCRVMDYGKYKYQLKKKLADARKKQVQVQIKEVKIRPKTEEHDYQFKVRNARRFLEEKNKVKVTVIFRGRELAYTNVGRQILERIAEEIKDVATIERSATMEGRAMTMMLTPK